MGFHYWHWRRDTSTLPSIIRSHIVNINVVLCFWSIKNLWETVDDLGGEVTKNFHNKIWWWWLLNLMEIWFIHLLSCCSFTIVLGPKPFKSGLHDTMVGQMQQLDCTKGSNIPHPIHFFSDILLLKEALLDRARQNIILNMILNMILKFSQLHGSGPWPILWLHGDCRMPQEKVFCDQ